MTLFVCGCTIANGKTFPITNLHFRTRSHLAYASSRLRCLSGTSPGQPVASSPVAAKRDSCTPPTLASTVSTSLPRGTGQARYSAGANDRVPFLTLNKLVHLLSSLTNQIELRDPTGICVDPAGSVLVASSGSGCVQVSKVGLANGHYIIRANCNHSKS